MDNDFFLESWEICYEQREKWITDFNYIQC